MNAQVENMSLKDFIDEMKSGWNFRRTLRVRQIGQAIKDIFVGRENDLATMITVKYDSGSYGYGPSFHYTYDWEIIGVELPGEQSLDYYQARNLYPITGGFRCGYVW